ncbi:hypothetical protein ASL83_003462 [Vibrio parahaemolyticus]|uniref:Uncharacterized protein n=2 Tax=Vibrio harveyi group TaxID=717610 RepID=A0A9Q3UAZ5_VIBPH|nr:hypothetical protein [Vibrio parahaemolyticus]ELA8176448.1 hypothetical protein [Vibrio alginolyticus]CAH1592881.1 conserved hypothetical protein [Vibrio jasicida]EJE4724694.1 hypothetical protein [Vibrio parahaemolyticus]EJO2026061.1 hypothetical protein [Vibrio parahaemolyticus]MCC3803884.1 hypothetical protein [Vibrio parahaemolyticus]
MSYQTTSIPSKQLIEMARAESFMAFTEVNEIRTTTLNALMSKPDLISFDVVEEVDKVLKRELLESKRKHNHWLAMSEMRENLEAPLQVQTYKF